MDIVVYGREGTALTGMIRDTAVMQYRLLHFLTPESYDAYLAALRSSVPEIICIAVPGAVGMEAAIAATSFAPRRHWCGLQRMRPLAPSLTGWTVGILPQSR